MIKQRYVLKRIGAPDGVGTSHKYVVFRCNDIETNGVMLLGGEYSLQDCTKFHSEEMAKEMKRVIGTVWGTWTEVECVECVEKTIYEWRLANENDNTQH